MYIKQSLFMLLIFRPFILRPKRLDEQLEMYPTGTCKSWCSSTTLQRRLSLEKVNDAFLIASNPVKELDKLKGNIKKFPNIIVN